MRSLPRAFLGCLVVIVCCFAILGASPARADERDDAKREFTDGQAADRRRDWTGAIEHYLRAYDLVPHPFALYNIAADYEQLGKLREAAHYYKIYLESPDATDRDKVARTLAELKTRPAKFVARSQPDGARVTIDGQVVGATPYTGKLKGGVHRVVVDHDDQRDEKTVTIEFGEPVELTFSLSEATGTLLVNGYPVGALVTVDGAVAGTMPVQVPMAPGTHKVEVAYTGHSPFETSSTVTAGMITVVPVRLTRSLGGLPDGTEPPSIKLNYVLGVAAGVDAGGNGTALNVEFGIRGKQFEAVILLGKVIGLTSFEAQIRYAITSGRLAPILGGGYSYLGYDGAGWEAFAGMRYELLVGRKVGIGLLGGLTARYASTSTESTTMPQPAGIFPITVTLQIYYR